MSLRQLLFALLLAPALACSADGVTEDLLDAELDDGKADSLKSPTEHNAYFFGTTASASIGDAGRTHSWQFFLPGDAKVHFEAFNADFASPSDTTLYIYKRSNAGGGTWKRVDYDAGADGQDPVLDLALRSGTYRVIVRGKTVDSRERASVWGTCEGAGCRAPDELCLFGGSGQGLDKLPESYVRLGDPASTDHLTIERFEGTSPASMQPAQILEAYATANAVVSMSEPAQTTLAEVFADVETVALLEAQDRSEAVYGLYQFVTKAGTKVDAFFHTDVYNNQRQLGALYIDDELRLCAERAPVCAFGAELADLEAESAVMQTKATRTISSDGPVNELTAAQIATAAQQLPSGARDQAGRGDATITTLERRGIGSTYTMVTFEHDAGAGVVRYGLVFGSDSLKVVASINADRIERCEATRESKGITR